MADWTKPFEAAYSWWRVPRSSFDPDFSAGFFDTGYETERVDNITSGRIEVNNDTKTFETATVNCVGPLDVGTDLLRCHMTATFEDGTTEDVVLGTFLVNVPARDVHGSYEECEARLDGRLMELADDAFESVYVIPKGRNGASYYARVVRNCGLTFAEDDWPTDLPYKAMDTMFAFGLTADSDEPGGSKLDFIAALNELWGCRAPKTDEYGRIEHLAPVNYESEPVWSFVEGINATFLSDATDERDATKVCNVVRAIYENEESTVVGIAVDDDPESPYSTVTLGRRKVATYSYQDTVEQSVADATAQQLLETNQSIVHRVTIKHVWCGARVGDIVELRYPSAGISGKFAIRTQTIEVGSGGCLCTSELRRFERA